MLADPVQDVPDTQPAPEELPTTEVNLNADQMRLQSALESLASQAKINLTVNWTALKQGGVEKTTPISAKLRHVPFSRALQQVLASVGGTARR